MKLVFKVETVFC